MSSPLLPYGRQLIEDDDVAAVVEVLRGDFLSSGPAIERFEAAFAECVGARHAIVCNSGTAALYLAARGMGLQQGDVVIVPSVTFAATASAQLLAGLDVVLADVDPQSGLMTVREATEALDRCRARGLRARAIAPVHLTGQASDPVAMKAFASANDLLVVEDACHALGTVYGPERAQIGSCKHSQAACFSFHPVKTIAMGEGGAVTTNDEAMSIHMRRLRGHGISRAPSEFTNDAEAWSSNRTPNAWYYELGEISHNLRASDINCALGTSQLKKLPRFVAARRRLAERYRVRLGLLEPHVRPIALEQNMDAAWHLFCVLVDFEGIGVDRHGFMQHLRACGVGTQVHYIPLHLQPFHRRRDGWVPLPGAEAYYSRVLSLPLYVEMTEQDVDRVVATLAEAVRA